MILLQLSDLLLRGSIRLNGNKLKTIKTIARCLGCSLFVLICYLCRPYGLMVLVWVLICLLIFFAEKAWMGSLGKLFASIFFDSI